jgi:polysaccharide biosynthesis protein PelG
MAGIGFVLRELQRKETMVGTASSLGHGMIVAAGPWIFTVVSLALIHRGTSALLTSSDGYDFRSFIMYAFAISLVATAPVVNVSVRLTSNDIYRRTFTMVRSRYLAALTASCLASAALAIAVHTLLFSLSPPDLLIAVGSTVVVSMVWPTLAFCGAVRDYKGITAGFAAGMLISIVGTIWAARHALGMQFMIVMYLCGLSIIFFVLASRILLTFPDQTGSLGAQLAELGDGLQEHWMLAAGSLLSIAAVWADKWIMWFGPAQVRLSNGLVSAPSYDGAMFLAYLVMIPALGMFVTAIETSFFDNSRRLLDSIEGKAPLGRLERLAGALEKQTYRTIREVLITLGALCVLAILLSPSAVSWIGLRYEQLGVLRLGILAAFFQFMFLACSSIVLFLDRQAAFLALQLSFFVLQAFFTLMSIYLGPHYFGFGHLLACAMSAVISMSVLERTLGKIIYLTFAAAHHKVGRGHAVASPTGKAAPRVIGRDFEEESLLVLPLIQPGPLLRP